MVLLVVAGRHVPHLLLRVIGDRKLVELTGTGLVEVGAGIAARAKNPIHFLFEDVDWLVFVVNLMTAKLVFAVLQGYLVVALGSRVWASAPREVLDYILLPGLDEGFRHAGFLI